MSATKPKSMHCDGAVVYSSICYIEISLERNLELFMHNGLLLEIKLDRTKVQTSYTVLDFEIGHENNLFDAIIAMLW